MTTASNAILCLTHPCVKVSANIKGPEPTIKRFLAQARSALEIVKVWRIDFIRIRMCFLMLRNIRTKTTVDHDHFVVLEKRKEQAKEAKRRRVGK
jgi:hypothetical protein